MRGGRAHGCGHDYGDDEEHDTRDKHADAIATKADGGGQGGRGGEQRLHWHRRKPSGRRRMQPGRLPVYLHGRVHEHDLRRRSAEARECCWSRDTTSLIRVADVAAIVVTACAAEGAREQALTIAARTAPPLQEHHSCSEV